MNQPKSFSRQSHVKSRKVEGCYRPAGAGHVEVKNSVERSCWRLWTCEFHVGHATRITAAAPSKQQSVSKPPSWADPSGSPNLYLVRLTPFRTPESLPCAFDPV